MKMHHQILAIKSNGCMTTDEWLAAGRPNWKIYTVDTRGQRGYLDVRPVPCNRILRTRRIIPYSAVSIGLIRGSVHETLNIVAVDKAAR